MLFVLCFYLNQCFRANKRGICKKFTTPKSVERFSAEKGINQAFIEYLAPDGIMFFPNPVMRGTWKARPASPAFLTWNPTFIDVYSNGALGYSIGNSVYRPQGKDDTNVVYGQYMSVWQRQPDGNYGRFYVGIQIQSQKNRKPIGNCRRSRERKQTRQNLQPVKI